MATRIRRAACLAVFVVCGIGSSTPGQQNQANDSCTVDLTNPGQMKDILSNALRLGLDQPETSIDSFLASAESRYDTGSALLSVAAIHFELSEAVLKTEVEAFRHCNCNHDVGPGQTRADARVTPAQNVGVTDFAKDVTLHVVLHEMGHALIREFDLPVLANEETAADAFATYYLTTYLPDRAVDVLEARTTSLMIEARESPVVDWTGEHNHDGRRAYQIAALAVAADPDKYASVGAVVGMSDGDISSARDYGSEIQRSWRRVLAPLWMPDGLESTEARVTRDDGAFVSSLCADGFDDEVEAVLKRFDWHSQVTIHFAEGDGGAGWNRSRRTVTVNSEYVRRFVTQGEQPAPK